MKKICLFGASGSIGQSTIELVRANPDKFKIVGASAGTRFKDLEKVAAGLGVEHLLDTSQINPPQSPLVRGEVKRPLQHPASPPPGKGELEGVCSKIKEFIAQCEPDMVLNAVGGFAGLPFTLATLESELPLALANKESLVAAGGLVMELSRANNAPIIPVDSEHSAIWQCLIQNPPQSPLLRGEVSASQTEGNTKTSAAPLPLTRGSRRGFWPPEVVYFQDFKKILLTCSGGPFFGQTDLSQVTREQALKHPNWDMGNAITIDSATLANKCLEFFEALHLFAAKPDQIEIVVHPQSVVHSMVQFADSSIMAQLSPPSMQLPIAYALNWPERSDYGLETPDFSQLDLSFRQPDKSVFRTLQVLEHCAEHMQNLPIVFNAANEEARNAFIRGQIPFVRIFEVLESVVERTRVESVDSLETVYAVDKRAREEAQKLIMSS